MEKLVVFPLNNDTEILIKGLKETGTRLSLLGAFVDVVAHVHIVLRLGYLSIMRMLQEWLLVMTIA